MAAAFPERVLDKFFPICTTRILAELEYGASSTRTTNTGVAVSSIILYIGNMRVW